MRCELQGRRLAEWPVVGVVLIYKGGAVQYADLRNGHIAWYEGCLVRAMNREPVFVRAVLGRHADYR